MVILQWHIHKIQTESIIKYMPTFLLVVAAVVVVVALFRVYAMGQRFLPLLEAPLKPTFRNHVYDSHRLFLNFRDILKITALLLFSFSYS